MDSRGRLLCPQVALETWTKAGVRVRNQGRPAPHHLLHPRVRLRVAEVHHARLQPEAAQLRLAPVAVPHEEARLVGGGEIALLMLRACAEMQSKVLTGFIKPPNQVALESKTGRGNRKAAKPHLARLQEEVSVVRGLEAYVREVRVDVAHHADALRGEKGERRMREEVRAKRAGRGVVSTAEHLRRQLRHQHLPVRVRVAIHLPVPPQ